MAKINTTLLHKGVSQYTGNPINVFLTESSTNTKTGNIPQVNFLPEVKPTDALKTGQDADVCGNCPLRPFLFNPETHDAPCYVLCGFAPNAIHRAKNKPLNDYSKLYDVIRIGAYGDGASCEKQALIKIVKLAKKVLNYTHAWSIKKFNFLKAFSMASVHSIEEKIKANSLGFRTFRTIKFACSKLEANEIVCPNFVDNSIQCKTCKLCCGNQIKAKIDIVIPSH
ncbi:MAG: hypothetical protein CL489_17715 [Acidobacteria bacterium]|nr:hypothetical protein [Acidobacteriota bacterium]